MKVSAVRILAAASIPLVLGLTSCAGNSVPEQAPTPSENSASSSPSSSPEASETKSFVSGKDYRRDVSNPSHTTIVGEPVLEAEQRFVNAAVNKVKVEMNREDILRAGYKICHIYSEEGTNDATLDRITAESNNDEEGKIIMLSGVAVKTLCPEYKDLP